MGLFSFLDLHGLTIYMAAALLPAVILMIYIYNKDKTEKEPSYMIRKMILGGIFAGFTAMALEYAGQYILVNMFSFNSEAAFNIAVAVMVGLSEEGAKLFFTRRGSWKDPNLNYTFDAIVYCVFVSLGFAAMENIIYVFSYGLSVAFVRAVVTIPAHMCFAVFMGVFYAEAKRSDVRGRAGECRKYMVMAFLVPVVLHAVFDGLLMVGTDLTITVFYIYAFLLDIAVYFLIRNQSRNDKRIY